jgi:hypothetical protein
VVPQPAADKFSEYRMRVPLPTNTGRARDRSAGVAAVPDLPPRPAAIPAATLGNMPDEKRTITFDLNNGDTFSILVNALSAEARLVQSQSDEQRSFGNSEYANSLHRSALEVKEMLAKVKHARPDTN